MVLDLSMGYQHIRYLWSFPRSYRIATRRVDIPGL